MHDLFSQKCSLRTELLFGLLSKFHLIYTGFSFIIFCYVALSSAISITVSDQYQLHIKTGTSRFLKVVAVSHIYSLEISDETLQTTKKIAISTLFTIKVKSFAGFLVDVKRNLASADVTYSTLK